MLVTSDRLVAHVPVVGEILERLALSLWDEKGREDTKQHEESEDLHDVVEPWVSVGLGGTAGTERSDGSLGNDRTNLS